MSTGPMRARMSFLGGPMLDGTVVLGDDGLARFTSNDGRTAVMVRHDAFSGLEIVGREEDL